MPQSKTTPTRKDVMVELNKNGKWNVRTTGSKAHVSFDTQADAITYAELQAKKYQSEIRVKSQENRVRLTRSFRPTDAKDKAKDKK